jgi:hypothetical protein
MSKLEPASGAGPAPQWKGSWSPWKWDLLALGILLLATLPWWRAVSLPFLLIDDHAYVTQNADVLRGLTLQGISNVFHSTTGGLWSPLTFVSLMADVSMFGKGPAGMHATNVALHIANAFLLYVFLRRTTGRPGRSLLVAALFVMHPLRVESVAWVTERKDVLAAFFGLLALLAYANYAWSARKAGLRRAGWYVLVCVLFACSFMSKPMLITMPFLLLLLDYWPLQRVSAGNATAPASMSRQWLMLVLEKIPLFIMTIAMCIITVYVQVSHHALASNAHTTLLQRAANAAVSYALYLRDQIYFIDLSIYYPQTVLSIGDITAALMALVAVSVMVVWAWRSVPERGKAALVGWCLFLGVLIQNIGLLQSGGQQRADRYTYFPSIGIFLAIVWLWPDRWLHGRGKQLAAATGAGAVLVLTVYTVIRIELWRDPLSLFLDGLAHTGPNPVLSFTTAQMLQISGSDENAITYYREAIRTSPTYHQAYNNLAAVLIKQGDKEGGVEAFKKAVELDPGNQMYLHNYKRALEMLHEPAATGASTGTAPSTVDGFRSATR